MSKIFFFLNSNTRFSIYYNFFQFFRLQLKYNRNVPEPKSILKPIDQRIPLPQSNSPVKDQISTSRMNLLNALNKAKSQQSIQPVKKSKSPASNSSSSPTVSEKNYSGKSTDGSSTSKMIEDEDEEFKARQIIQNQEMFLRLFNLYTPDKVEEIKARRSERRRRNVTSTEKVDFHYGRIENYDQQKQIKKKTSIMYSPPATRVSKKKKRVIDTTSTMKGTLKCNNCKNSTSKYFIL